MRATFHKVSYITTQGAVIDISDLIVEFSIYQNIFEHYMQCELVLSDAVGLSLATKQDIGRKINGGFSGGEMLVVQYTANQESTKANTFVLYERSNRTKSKETVETYILAGISLEAFDAYPRKISRAYGMPNGNTIDKMVKSLYEEYVSSRGVLDQYGAIKSTLNVLQEKGFYSEATSGLQRFIIPNLSVDDTINFFCNEAQSAGYASRYLFWERQEGFFFKNLETLVENSVPVRNYYYTEFNVNQTDQDLLKIISYTIQKETNFLENARDGMYKSKTIHLDVLKKKTTETIFDYNNAREKDDFKTLQQFYHNGVVNDSNMNVTLMTTRQGHDCNCQLFSAEDHLPKRIDNIVAQRKAYQKHLFNTILTVTVPGTTGVNAGDVVDLKFPLKSLLDGATGGSDPQLSGKYLVTKVRNKFNQVMGNVSPFVTVLECVKDTQIMEDQVFQALEADYDE